MPRAKQQEPAAPAGNGAALSDNAVTAPVRHAPVADKAAATRAPARKAAAKVPEAGVEHVEAEGAHETAAPGAPTPTVTAPEAQAAPRRQAKAAKQPKPAEPAPQLAGASGPDGEAGDEAEFIDHQRAVLVAERNNYTRQVEELRAQTAALALEHEPGDVQFDEEGGEGGTANVDRELDLHLSAQAQAAIEEIDAALSKIDAGTYGICESCGRTIPRARLEALPHARLCVTCKSGGLAVRRQ